MRCHSKPFLHYNVDINRHRQIDTDIDTILILLAHTRETLWLTLNNNCHTVNCLWREPHGRDCWWPLGPKGSL